MSKDQDPIGVNYIARYPNPPLLTKWSQLVNRVFQRSKVASLGMHAKVWKIESLFEMM